MNMRTSEDIIGLLNQFHNDAATQKLIARFLTPTLFDIIDKHRSETAHTNFLKWLFNIQFLDSENCPNPIHGLIRILCRRALEQNKYPELGDSKTIESLRKASYISLSNIRIVKVTAEYPCPGVRYKSKQKDDKDNKGRVDILIESILKINDNTQIPLNIVIENKVTSRQHDLQTWKYYSYFQGETSDKPEDIIIVEPRVKEKNEQNIFVFLTPNNPDEVKPDCNHYIIINYQDIMNEILEPIRSSINLSQRDKIFIEEYIRNLSIPHIDKEKSNIMCLPPEDKILLKEFYEKNKRLIKLSLKALAESADDDDDSQESARNTLVAIEELESKRKHFRLIIDNKTVVPSNNMRNIQEDVVKYLLKCGESIENIKKIFPFWRNDSIYTEQEAKNLNPQKRREIFINEKDANKKGAKIRYTPISFGSETFYLRKEWKAPLFHEFREILKKKFPNIQIIDV